MCPEETAMSFNDRWLVNKAQQKKALLANGLPRRPLLKSNSLPPIDELWSALQYEVRRQAKVYTDALGDADALVVETPPDAIEIRVPDGRQLTLSIDRERRVMRETYVDGGGAKRIRTPSISFVLNAQGEVTFNFGGLQAVGGSILRRFVN
jgi:hypothetical protein